MPCRLRRSHTHFVVYSLLLLFAVAGQARLSSEEVNQALEVRAQAYHLLRLADLVLVDMSSSSAIEPAEASRHSRDIWSCW